MLAAVGLPGPRIDAVALPAESRDTSDMVVAATRSRLLVGELPMVLCVGTHEPRKNHLGVLHAAEVLWRRGVQFSLTFIGGHSWSSARFEEGLARLQAAGRPVETLSGITDEEL